MLERPAPHYVGGAMFEGFLGSESRRFHRRTVDLKLQNDSILQYKMSPIVIDGSP